jgi:hypothetical protein
LEGGYLTVRSADAIILEHRPVDRRAVTLSVPYGKYTVTFEGGTVRPRTREMVVDRSEVLLVLGTRVSDVVGHFADSVPTGISIRVNPSRKCSQGPIWAKVIGVFSDYSAERTVNSYGYALFEPVEPGQYMVLVMEGPQVRAKQLVTVVGKTLTAEVQLDECSLADNKSR